MIRIRNCKNTGLYLKTQRPYRPLRFTYLSCGQDVGVSLLPNITPHVCRHTYCSNQAKAGMNPKTLQYLMGHSDIGVTMNVYTHLGMEDAAAEMARMEEVESARREQEKLNGVKEGKEKQSRKMFRVV